MPKKGQLFLTLLLVSIVLFANSAYASKTTDLMSEALKHRSNGNLNAAIKNFKLAVESAPSPLQKNLALSMLGDCQMEVGKYNDALKAFTELSQRATTSEERAEALYKMMEANSNLGNSGKVKEIFSEVKKKYSKTAFYEIAVAFMNAEKIMESDYQAPVVKEEPKSRKDPKTEVQKQKPVTEVPLKSDSKKQSIKTEEPKTAVKKEDKKVKEQNEKIKEQKPAKSQEMKAEQKPVSPKKETVSKTSENKAENKNVKTQAVSSQKETVSKTSENKAENKNVKNQAVSSKKLDGKTTALLEEILYIEPISDSERDSLVSKILDYQDKLKSGEKGTGKDKVLFELADATARFGELLEACKNYDKVLSYHPTSPYVEDSYYQAIRLRAMLGVYQTVVEWSRAFNAAFPESKFKKHIEALVAYSKAGGKVQLNKKSSSNTKKEKAKAKQNNTKTVSQGKESANVELKASSLYKEAVKKMNDGDYQSVLEDLKVLAGKYGDSSQLWWDMTLVYVQLEKFKEADKSIRRMLLLEPDNSDANSLLGYIQYRLENYEEAASAYENAGETEGEGVTFFDAKTASERMKKNASK